MFKKKILFIIIFTSPLFCQDQEVTTFIAPRSQSFNAARKLVGWEHIIHDIENEYFHGAFALIGEITKSFRPERINQCLFGDDIIKREVHETEWKDILTISGSRTENRIRKMDWLADYFGLPTDFKSSVHFRPRVNNFLLEADAYFGLNNWLHGLYARIHVPLVYTNWDLNIEEVRTEIGTNNHDPGYFNATGLEREKLLFCFTEFISGSSAPEIEDVHFHKLMNTKMHSCSRRIVRLAELRTEIGYDFWQTDRFVGGFNIRAAAPLGNRPKAEFLFEPLVGNGKHWEAGVGFSSHINAWENNDTNEHIDLFIDINIMHLFTTRQRRTFDLKQKPNSRYILSQKLTTEVENNLTGNGTHANAQFANELAPIANFTTFDVDVSVNAQAEFALLFAYTHNLFTFSFGYSIWKRGCENIEIKNKSCFPENTWAIKGDAHVFGFVGETNPGDLPLNTPVALSATQNNATINAGNNFPKQGLSTQEAQKEEQIKIGRRNPRIDFPQPAFAGNNQRLVASNDDLTQENQINTSIQPVFITFADIDIHSARTSGLAHKFFGQFTRRWDNITLPDTYIGLGTEVDIGKRAGPTPAIGADECLNCALSQWGVWLKGGITF